MIVVIDGVLAAVKMVQPEKNQEFKAHQLLSITQVIDGKVEVVYVKDEDLAGKHPEGKSVRCKAIANHWMNGNRGGLSLKFQGYEV